jgi:hypothetical protein
VPFGVVGVTGVAQAVVWLSAFADTVLTVNDQELLAAVASAIAGTRIAQSFARPGYGVWFVLDNRSAFSIERRGNGWDIADVTDCL